MKRNNKKSNKNKNQISAPRLQLSNQINLFNRRASAFINVTTTALVYGYFTTAQFSFNSGSDVRFIAFSTITASTEFGNFSAVYADYRIKECSVIVSPLLGSSAYTGAVPMLLVGCNPLSNTGNPTNSEFILRDNTHMFSHSAILPKSVKFTFSGVGTSSNIWQPVSATPTGELYIGGVTFGGLYSTTGAQFEMYINLLIEFNNIK